MIRSDNLNELVKDFLDDCYKYLDSEQYKVFIEQGYNLGLSIYDWGQVYAICRDYLHLSLEGFAEEFIREQILIGIDRWKYLKTSGIRLSAFKYVYLNDNLCGLSYDQYSRIIKEEVAKLPDFYIQLEAGFNVLKHRN